MKNILYTLLLALLTTTVHAQKDPSPIHVEVRGEGTPVLLIPGFTVPGSSWKAVVDQLAEQYECHVVTLAGFGGNAPIAFPWLPKVNAALENYLQEQNLQQVTVIGHSLGGTIATWLASRENSKLERVILIDALPAAGALMIPNFDPEQLAYDSPYNNQQLAMSAYDFQQMATNMSKGMSLNTEAQEQIKQWILQADRKTYVYGYTDYLKLDLRDALKNISIPVTIIAADKPFGKEAVTKTYQDQYQNLENYKLVVAENAAHFVMFDQPDWFMAQLKSILSTN